MASNFKLGLLTRSASADGLVDYIDTGTGAGTIAIRSGAVEATTETASSGTLLGTLTFNATAFGAASSGVATANAIVSDTSADASADAAHFRCYRGSDGDTLAVCQGTAGEAADSTDMTFDNKTVVAGGTIAISAFTITVPTQ